MRFIFESWREYTDINLGELGPLNEVTFEDAKKSLSSKRTRKIIRKYNYNQGREPDHMIETILGAIIDTVIVTIPNDIEDKEKGQAVLWLIKLLRDAESFPDVIRELKVSLLAKRSIEKYFQNKRFMSEQDLMSIPSIGALSNIVLDADDAIKADQDKRDYSDAEKGTEVLLDDNQWYIAAAHNKGAACKLGKGTDWCTAAPGLDYFTQYYKPEDPLFVFIDKSNNEKYQVHYGSDQYMDANDFLITHRQEWELEGLLMKTSALKKYSPFRHAAIDHFIRDKYVSHPVEEKLQLLDAMDKTTIQVALSGMAPYAQDAEKILDHFKDHPDSFVRKMVVSHGAATIEILSFIVKNESHGAVRLSAKLKLAVMKKEAKEYAELHAQWPDLEANLDRLSQQPAPLAESLHKKWKTFLKESNDPDILRTIQRYVESVLEMQVKGIYPGCTETLVKLNAEPSEHAPEFSDLIRERWEGSFEFDRLRKMGYNVRVIADDFNIPDSYDSITKELL